jgi:hypothetical protein
MDTTTIPSWSAEYSAYDLGKAISIGTSISGTEREVASNRCIIFERTKKVTRVVGIGPNFVSIVFLPCDQSQQPGPRVVFNARSRTLRSLAKDMMTSDRDVWVTVDYEGSKDELFPDPVVSIDFDGSRIAIPTLSGLEPELPPLGLLDDLKDIVIPGATGEIGGLFLTAVGSIKRSGLFGLLPEGKIPAFDFGSGILYQRSHVRYEGIVLPFLDELCDPKIGTVKLLNLNEPSFDDLLGDDDLGDFEDRV